MLNISRFLIFLFAFISYNALSQDSKGKKGNETALIIIDMQPYFFTRGFEEEISPENTAKINQILEEQVKLIEIAKENKIPVIFVEYIMDEPKKLTRTNKNLRKAAGKYKKKLYFSKDKDGVFSASNAEVIHTYLDQNNVGNLIIVGANGGACVKESIQGALQNNFDVLVYTKAIADFDYKEFLYPYDFGIETEYGFYFDKTLLTCSDCSFKQVEDIEKVKEAILMVNLTEPKMVKDLRENNSLRNTPSKNNLNRKSNRYGNSKHTRQ